MIKVEEPRNNRMNSVVTVNDDADFQKAANNFQLLSLFTPIRKGNLSWRDLRNSIGEMYSSIGPFLTEYKTNDDNSLQDYVLLAGIPFRYRFDVKGLTLYPVVRKLKNGYYNGVGTIGAFGLDYFLNGVPPPPEQEYNIQ